MNVFSFHIEVETVENLSRLLAKGDCEMSIEPTLQHVIWMALAGLDVSATKQTTLLDNELISSSFILLIVDNLPIFAFLSMVCERSRKQGCNHCLVETSKLLPQSTDGSSVVSTVCVLPALEPTLKPSFPRSICELPLLLSSQLLFEEEVSRLCEHCLAVFFVWSFGGMKRCKTTVT